MKVTRFDEAFIVMQDSRMTGRRLYASDGATIIHMTIHPNQEIAPHTADVDMEFFVIAGSGRFSVGGESADAGSGRFSVGGESADAGPGMLVESPADIPHGIANTGSIPLELLAVKNGKGRPS